MRTNQVPSTSRQIGNNLRTVSTENLHQVGRQEHGRVLPVVSSCPATPTRGFVGFDQEDPQVIGQVNNLQERGRRLNDMMRALGPLDAGPPVPPRTRINNWQGHSRGGYQQRSIFNPGRAAPRNLSAAYNNLGEMSMRAFLGSRGVQVSSSIIPPVSRPQAFWVPNEPLNDNVVIPPAVSRSGGDPISSHSSHQAEEVELIRLSSEGASNQARDNHVEGGNHSVQGEAGNNNSAQVESQSIGYMLTNTPSERQRQRDNGSSEIQQYLANLQQNIEVQREHHAASIRQLREEIAEMNRRTLSALQNLGSNRGTPEGSGHWYHKEAGGVRQSGLFGSIQRESELQTLRSHNIIPGRAAGHSIQSAGYVSKGFVFVGGIQPGRLYSFDEYQEIISALGYPIEGLTACVNEQASGVTFIENGDSLLSVPASVQERYSSTEPAGCSQPVFSSENVSRPSNSSRGLQYSSARFNSEPNLVSAFASNPGYSNPNPPQVTFESSGASHSEWNAFAPPNDQRVNMDRQNAQLPKRSSSLQLRATDIPRYAGSSSEKTPYDFLIELEKFKTISRTSDLAMLCEVVPLALTDDAYVWLHLENERLPFVSWHDFRRRFRREFQISDYNQKLRRMMEDRFQGPDETLVSYIRTVINFYERLDDRPTSEWEKIEFINRHMHPEFRRALQGCRFNTISEMIEAAFEAQETINLQGSYQVPSTAPSIEPSLQYRPKQVGTRPLQSVLRSGEPQNTYVPKHVNFSTENRQRQASSSSSQFRPVSPAPFNPNNRPNSAASNRSQSPGVPRLCYHCNGSDHLKRDCPMLSDNRRPENSRTPSPNRQGFGDKDKTQQSNQYRQNQK
jgi:hypothetical protein